MKINELNQREKEVRKRILDLRDELAVLELEISKFHLLSAIIGYAHVGAYEHQRFINGFANSINPAIDSLLDNALITLVSRTEIVEFYTFTEKGKQLIESEYQRA